MGRVKGIPTSASATSSMTTSAAAAAADSIDAREVRNTIALAGRVEKARKGNSEVSLTLKTPIKELLKRLKDSGDTSFLVVREGCELTDDERIRCSIELFCNATKSLSASSSGSSASLENKQPEDLRLKPSE